MSKRKTILVVGAHMDDCEIGAGGLIIKAVNKGHRVVLVNCASDYSTWCITAGREKEVKEKILKKAKEMGVEKRFLGYGYQSVLPNIESIKKLSEIVVDVKPDIALFHNRFETAPSDHGNVGIIAEHAVRSATRVLKCKEPISYPGEMYAYEIYLRPSPPHPLFQPDTYIDISDVIKEAVEVPNYFDKLYAESEHAKGVGAIRSRIKIDYLENEEVLLHEHGEMKLTTARFRGFQCGIRYAEAYMALDKKKLGSRILQTIVSED